MNELSRHDLIWCLRLLPKAVKDQMQKRPNALFLAGGFIRAAIARESVSDIDLFVPNDDAATAVAVELKGCGDRRMIRTPNAWTVVMKPYPVQIIHRWTFLDPAACITSFDFTIARAAIWHDGKRWCSACDQDFYADLAAKRLVYCSPVRVEEAGGSMLRVLKFYQRGYRIPLDSLGAVVARLCQAVDWGKIQSSSDRLDIPAEKRAAEILTGLLCEVDPNVDPTHESHLPSMNQEEPAA